MSIDEAIKHSEEVAEEKKKEAWEAQLQEEYKKIKSCNKCAAEHRQLAEWLKELKQLREQTRWIPVSERLPETYREKLISLLDDIKKNCPEMEIIVDAPANGHCAKLGSANIYEDPKGRIVIDTE